MKPISNIADDFVFLSMCRSIISINNSKYCKPTFNRMKGNYAQFTSTSLSLITLAANQFLMSINFVNNSR